MIIRVDIDETICTTPFIDGERDYYSSTPLRENINKVNRLYEKGNTIIYWSSRGSKSKIDWTTLTKMQLEKWGAKYHELKLDKPYYDLLICDKSSVIEDYE